MRAVLILNPASGLSTIAPTPGSAEEHEETILATLRSNGVEAQLFHTTPEDTGQALAKRAAMDQADIVIVAGGDGTVHAVACGLIGTQSALGIIPLGTMNNLAQSLGIPNDIEAACAIIGQGETQAIDIGQINEHAFIEVAGVGLEAALFPAAEELKSPGWLSTVRGILSGLRILFSFRPTRLSISFDEHRRRPYHAIQVTICNAPYYGAHFHVAPDATMNDGLLDVVIYRHFSKLEYLRHAISISRGKRVYQPKIKHLRVKSLRINAATPVEVQADGVPLGHTPVAVTILPGVLHIRVPRVDVPGLANEAKSATLLSSKS